MNVIQFQAKKRARSEGNTTSSKPHSQTSVLSFSKDQGTFSNGISAEQREKAIAILLKEAEELDQA